MDKRLTPYQIADLADRFETFRSNRAEINRLFRLQDDSHLWPIKGRFSVTERAIRRARKENPYAAGLEYALQLHDIEADIVNNEENW